MNACRNEPIVNLAQDLMVAEPQCHNDVGTIYSYRAFEQLTNTLQVDFIDFVRITPGASIGRHFQANNYEYYVIINGGVDIWFKDEVVKVGPWDVLINPSYQEHGLHNNFVQKIMLIVIETSEVSRA